jgi:hypothetical protein
VQHLILPRSQLLEVVPLLESLAQPTVLVQIKEIHRPLENQRVHIVGGLLHTLVEGGQHVLRRQLVLQGGFTCAELMLVEGLCLGYKLL